MVDDSVRATMNYLTAERIEEFHLLLWNANKGGDLTDGIYGPLYGATNAISDRLDNAVEAALADLLIRNVHVVNE